MSIQDAIEKLAAVYAEEEGQPKLVYNAIQCPDGTVIESRYQHHFVSHIQDDGREYFVDGGLAYQRIGHSDREYIDLSLYDTDSIELIRERFTWGRNMDANNNLLPETQYIKLKDLADGHLDALVEFTKTHAAKVVNGLMIREQNYRKEKGLTVPQYDDTVTPS